jgi:hypothetical protein
LGESEARVPYGIYWPRIYRIRPLAHCVTNISYWLPLNEGFRCNCIKTNKYVIFVLCNCLQPLPAILVDVIWLTEKPWENWIIQKCKYPAVEGKNGKYFGKYPGGTKIIANSPWLLDNHEICFKYTCNGPIKTNYFLYKV